MKSSSVTVEGYGIHFLESGAGEPVLYVHGNPSSSFLWRNVMPEVSRKTGTRGLAVDLLGFGKSDKPNRDYTLGLHYRILSGFIEQLGLKRVSLVLHDWGGPLGVRYACDQPANVSRIALMESFLWNLKWADFPAEMKFPFTLMRSPLGFLMIQVMNGFLKQFVPSQVLAPMSPEVREGFEAPFPTIASRRGIREFPKLIPVERKPTESAEFFDVLEDRFPKLQIPKAWIVPRPGMGASDERLNKLAAADSMLKLVEFGPGKHFLQEDNPGRLAEILAEFIGRQAGPG